MVAGIRISISVWLMRRVAVPKSPPGAKLNEMVTAGNCPWWLTASAVLAGAKCAKVESGTCAPVLVITYTLFKASG